MSKKASRIIACTALAAVMSVSTGLTAIPAFADWHQNSTGYYYTDDNGKKLTGWQTIDGKKYLFSSKGISASGFKTINGRTFYFINTKKGQMATGWQKIGNARYYFGNDGVMRVGWKKIDGKTYYFNEEGKMVTGTVMIDGKKYSFDKNGVYKAGTTSLGKAHMGMSPEEVIAAEGIKKYTKKTAESGTVLIANGNILGVGCTRVYYLFNADSKLIGIYGFADGKSAFKKWDSVLSEYYPDADNESSGDITFVMYYDDSGEDNTAAFSYYDESTGVAEILITTVDDFQEAAELYLDVA